MVGHFIRDGQVTHHPAMLDVGFQAFTDWHVVYCVGVVVFSPLMPRSTWVRVVTVGYNHVFSDAEIEQFDAINKATFRA